MAVVLPLEAEYDSGLTDSMTGADCITEKVVDVTLDCPDRRVERCVLLFTRAVRGRIVQISFPYPHEKYMGTHIHFFVDELHVEFNVRAEHDTFGPTAAKLGLAKFGLRDLILQHAPA